MSKSRSLLITAAILVGIGTVGAIGSGIVAVPTVFDEIQNARLNYNENKGKVVYDSQDEVINLDVISKGYNEVLIEIIPSMDNSIKVSTQDGMFNNLKVSPNYDKNNKTLKLETENVDDINILEGEGNIFKRVYDGFIDGIASDGMEDKITIEVPKAVDVNVKSQGRASLKVKDNTVLKEKLSYDVASGYLDLPKFNNLKDIKIINNSHIDLDYREVVNAENVEILAQNVYIRSNGLLSDYENLKSIPKNVNIKGVDVEVESYMPLGSNVKISTDNSFDIDMDLNEYTVKGKIQIKTVDGYINEHDMEDEDKPIEGINIPMKNNKVEGQFSSGNKGNVYLEVISNGYGEFKNVSKEMLEPNLMRNR